MKEEEVEAQVREAASAGEREKSPSVGASSDRALSQQLTQQDESSSLNTAAPSLAETASPFEAHPQPATPDTPATNGVRHHPHTPPPPFQPNPPNWKWGVKGMPGPGFTSTGDASHGK